MSSMYLHITTEKIIKSKHLNCTFSIFHTLVGSFQSVLCSCSFTFIAKLQIFYMMNIITMSVMRNVCVCVGRSVGLYGSVSLFFSFPLSLSISLCSFVIFSHLQTHVCALIKVRGFSLFCLHSFFFSANCTHEDEAFPFNFQQFFFIHHYLLPFIYETHGNVCNTTIIFTFAAICFFSSLCALFLFL